MKKSFLKGFRDNKKKRIEAYYYGFMYKGQSYSVRILNYIIFRLLILVISFMFFLYFTEGEQPLAAFWAGVSVLIIYHLVAKYIFDNKFTQIKREVNAKIAEEEFWSRIKSMDKDSFVVFLQEVLAKLSSFNQVEITEYLESEGIDLLGKYQEELVAIQCQLLDGDNAVESRSARELSKAMSRRKYQKGIIISTTDFRDDTKHFCNLVKDKRQIMLLGKNELIQMAKDAGKYPSDEELKNLILKKIEHQTRNLQEARGKLFTKPRLMPYFIYGTLLFGCGIFFDLGIKYLYILGAFGLYFLGIIGLIINLKNKKRQESLGWQSKLF